MKHEPTTDPLPKTNRAANLPISTFFCPPSISERKTRNTEGPPAGLKFSSSARAPQQLSALVPTQVRLRADTPGTPPPALAPLANPQLTTFPSKPELLHWHRHHVVGCRGWRFEVREEIPESYGWRLYGHQPEHRYEGNQHS
jgi:hypothetical protein